MMEKQTTSAVRELCYIALMSAAMCLLGPISVPVGPVPISAMTLTIYLAVYILGARRGTVSCMVYLLLGFAGLPVFSGYLGGAARLLGPTGGYLVGYIFMALACGVVMEKAAYQAAWCVVAMLLGTAVLYSFGTVWFVLLTKCGLGYAVHVCVMPFIPGDLAKIVCAVLVGHEVRRRLKLASIL